MGRKAKYDIGDLITKSDALKIQHDGAKCYIYTRVSTNKQAVEGGGLDAQRQRILDYAAYEHMTVVREYSDEGISGKSVEQRIQFLQMIDDAVSGKDGAKFVLVFKLSRFGRNARDILDNLQTLQDYGVNLICVEDHIDSSDGTGKLMVSIMAAMAEIERDNILVQSMAGRYKTAENGKRNGANLPYGYMKKDGKIIIDEEQAEKVRLIFDKYVNTSMLADGVARWLNEHGYKKTPPHIENSKRDDNAFLTAFSRDQIVRILDNEFYMGKIAFGKRKNYSVKGHRGVTVTRRQSNYQVYEGEHEGIVSEELWQMAHEKRLATSGKPEKKDQDHEYILSTLLRCPECGAPMYGAVNRTKKRADGTPYDPYYYYKCKNQFNQTGKQCSFKTQIGCRKIDKAVRDIVMSLVTADDFADALKEKLGQQIDVSEIETAIKTLEDQKRRIEGTLRKRSEEKDGLDIDDPFYDDKYEEIVRAMDKLYYRKSEIVAAIEEHKDRILAIEREQVSRDGVYQSLLYFAEVYDDMTDALKKEFMSAFIERIEIFKEKRSDGRRVKEIVFNFPVSFNGEDINSVIFPSLENTCEDDCLAFQG